MQIPILKGIYTGKGLELRDSYPRNLTPVVQGSGISDWYFRSAPGLEQFGIGPTTPDRGGINWRGEMYRVFGSFLVKVSSTGVVTTLGSFAGATTDTVTMDYSFDRLAIAVSGNLYYWNGTTLTQVTDPDLGNVIDMVWVDGYFMTTDGTSLVVTELNDPFAVNPLKYGSSEADSDPVVALLKLKNEVYALNRHTIEVFDNVGGTLFPFARIEGAQVQKGVVGTHACTLFMDAIAFVGGGRNESPQVYLGVNSQALKLSTREVDTILMGYSEAVLSAIVVESRVDKDHAFLYIHLPDKTLVYDGLASQALKGPVWTILTSSVRGDGTYKARHFVWCYDKWLCGDPTSSRIGQLTDDANTHYGETVGWEFSTPVMYNNGKGALVHELELVTLGGKNQPRIKTVLPFTPVWEIAAVHSRTWRAIIWTGNLYVMTGVSGFDSVATSPDGINWTLRSTPVPTPWFFGMVWNGVMFVIVGLYTMTSPDGINWTSRTNSGTFRGVTWTGTQFVAVGDTGGSTSPDGINWTLRSTPPAPWYAIAWNGSLLVAVGANGVMTSPDGINWTLRSTPPSSAAAWVSLLWAGGLFIAGASDGGANGVMTSPDGINWTLRSTPVQLEWNGIAWNGTEYLIVGNGVNVLRSLDGVTWLQSSILNSAWNGVVWDSARFVAVAGSSNVARSQPVPTALLDAPPELLWTSYSTEGVTWGTEKPLTVGVQGDFRKRLIWRQQGHFRNWRIQRFRGTAPLTIARLEATIEALEA